MPHFLIRLLNGGHTVCLQLQLYTQHEINFLQLTPYESVWKTFLIFWGWGVEGVGWYVYSGVELVSHRTNIDMLNSTKYSQKACQGESTHNLCLPPSTICGKSCFLHILPGPLKYLAFLMFGIITDIKYYRIVLFICISLITR